MGSTLYIGSDSLVVLDHLTDHLTDAYINTATVTGALLDGTSSLATFTLNYETLSDGKYEGVIPAATTDDLVPGHTYEIRVTANKSGSLLVKSLYAVARNQIN